MTNIVKILQWILIGILLGAVCFLLVTKCNSDKKNTQLSKELQECLNAPVKVDTVFDTIRIVELRYIKPTPKPKPNDGWIPPTTNTKCSNITSTYYSDTFKEKGVRIHWEALASCENDSSVLQYIRFPEIVIPKEIMTNTKIIHDTIPIEIPAKIKSKFLFYGGTGIHSFNEFPSLELGAGYSYRNTWGVMLGPMYADKKIYGTIKVFVTL